MNVKALLYHYFIPLVTYSLVLLLSYAALSKWLDFENFQVQLAQSPLLSAYAGIIAPATILVELLITIGLLFAPTRLIALYASWVLMLVFTLYIYMILQFSDFIPCSCGGILEHMSWKQHAVFNLSFALATLIAIYLMENQQTTRKKIILVRASLPLLVAGSGLVFLFMTSERLIKTENPFIRRFIQHPILKDTVYDLKVNSYYFAGIAYNQLYLGNRTAPLLLTTLDTTLRHATTRPLKLDTMHRFRSLQLHVKAPFLYISDGSVPVIYRAPLEDTLATTLSFQDCYFSQWQVLDSLHLVFRSQSSQSQRRILGSLDLTASRPKVTLHPQLLQTQGDGMFDTDGSLLQDPISGELIYVYRYCNTFLVMDSTLNLKQALHTIDTVHKPDLQIRTLDDGRHRMDAPPLVVNKTGTSYRGILLNPSNLMGRFESRELWKSSAIIDLYRTQRQEYLGSFYLHEVATDHNLQLLVTNRYLFVLSGTQLIRYHFTATYPTYHTQGKPKT